VLVAADDASSANPQLSPAQRVLIGMRDVDVAVAHLRGIFAERHGLSANDALVISILSTSDTAMTPTAVGRALTLSSGTLTSIIDRLESAGLVSRVPHPSDRRSVVLALSDSARRDLESVRERIRRSIDDAIGADGLEDFAARLDALAKAIHSSLD
jgi:DNA-binding MarR family transcriptional regulator